MSNNAINFLSFYAGKYYITKDLIKLKLQHNKKLIASDMKTNSKRGKIQGGVLS